MGAAFGPVGLVVLQSTGFCNIDCSYCYLPDRAKPHQRMELATVAATARLIFDDAVLDREIDLVWHAGEPLTLPPDYYEQAIAIVEAARPQGLQVHYGIQTNGTLIDDAWIDLFEKHSVTLGISLDGPRDLHDGKRKYRNGAGSHDRVIAGIAKLQARGYPFHFIGVVTAHSLSRAGELARYYRAFRPTAIGLNIEELEAQNRHSSLYAGLDVADYERFIAEFLRGAAAEGEPDVVIRDFQRTISSLVSGTPDDNDQVVPLRIVSIAFNGDISTFSPELLALDEAQRNRFIFGNVHRCGALTDILADDAFRAAHAEIRRGVEACAGTCRYFHYCGGGAPVNKLSETGRLDAAETVYCKLTKQAWVDVCLRLATASESQFEFTAPRRG